MLLTTEEQERQRADQAEAQVRQIALNLLPTGMKLEQVVQMIGLGTAYLQKLQK